MGELPLPRRQRPLQQLLHVDHPRLRVAVLVRVLRLLHGLVPGLPVVARGDVGLQREQGRVSICDPFGTVNDQRSIIYNGDRLVALVHVHLVHFIGWYTLSVEPR